MDNNINKRTITRFFEYITENFPVLDPSEAAGLADNPVAAFLFAELDTIKINLGIDIS